MRITGALVLKHLSDMEILTPELVGDQIEMVA
jgi:hypothetical protein